MTTSRKTESLQLFKESLLSTGNLGLEDQVEAVQFLEKRLEESRKLAGEKCEEIRKALNIKAESDGEPPVKKQRFGPSNEIDEENGNILPRDVNNLPVEKNTPEHARRTEEVSEGSRSNSDEQLKMDLEDALENIKTKEEEAKQLKEALAVKDAEMKTKEHQLTVEKRQLEEKLAGQTKALEAVEQQKNAAQQENRKKSAKLLEIVKELNAANAQARSASNSQSILARQINELKKSINSLEHENLAKISKHENEIAKVKKEAEEIKVVRYDLEVALEAVKTKEAEAEQLKKAVAGKDAELSKSNSTVIQLKHIGRNFREKAERAEKTLKDFLETNQKRAKELEAQNEETKEKKENLSSRVEEEKKELHMNLEQLFGTAVTTIQCAVNNFDSYVKETK